MTSTAQTAMQVLETRQPFYWQARRYCEDRDLGPESLPSVAHYLAVQSFHERAKPWVDAKARWFNLSMQPPPPETYAAIDEVIKAIAKECGLEVLP